MECLTVKSKLSAYLDGAVSEEERLKLRLHLHSCRICSRDSEKYQRLRDALPDQEGFNVVITAPDGVTTSIFASDMVCCVLASSTTTTSSPLLGAGPKKAARAPVIDKIPAVRPTKV